MSTRNGRAGPYAHDIDRYALAVARSVKKPKGSSLAPKKRRKAHTKTFLAAPDVLKRGWTLAAISVVPRIGQGGKVRTWVSSRGKNPCCPGHFSVEINIKEKRGNKEKKILAVDESEAPVVRKIFSLASGQEGRPVGVKAIASYLNERGVSRRGRRFSTGGVHELLSSTTYYGVHYFNRRDSRNGKPRRRSG